MVLMLPPRQQQPSTSQRFIDAFGTGLEAVSTHMKEKQKKEQTQQALQNIEGAYANPQLNEQQRLIKAYQQLAGSGNPELANQLGGHLSRIGGQQEKFKNKILGKQQDQDRLAKSFQNIQNLYNDPELSEEQKVFGVYQELNQNPTLAHNLLGSINQQHKAQGDDVAGQQYSKGYNAILEGDNESLKGILEDPATPLTVKRQLTDLKNKNETRKDVQARELRGRQSLVQKSYKQAIASEREKLKDIYLKKPEINSINKNIKKLEALQRNDLKRLSKNPDSYSTLSLWNAVDPDYLPEDMEDFEGMESMGGQEQIEEEKPQRKKLTSDAERQDAARQLLRESNGNKKEAMRLFEERYE